MNKQLMNLQRISNKLLSKLDNKKTLYSVLGLLVLYSAFIVNFMPNIFISFVDSILGKIVMILLIVIVGMKSKSVALLLALAFVITLQRAQMMRMSGNLVELKIMEKMQNYNQSEEEESHNQKPIIEKLSDSGVSANVESAFPNSEGINEGFSNFFSSLLPNLQTENKTESNDVLGFNSNVDCSMCCGKSDDGQCSSVKTFNNEYSAQGLGCMDNVGGYVKSEGHAF
jgi:hypothetical protein